MEEDKLVKEIIKNEIEVPLMKQINHQSKTDRLIEEIVKVESEYDPSVILKPQLLGYDKANQFLAMIINTLECNYLIGC